MPNFRYVVADVFTDRALEGNQLAVFTDAREIPEEQLQRLAREMNLSETVFVYPPEADGHVRLRIFTPVAEMEFAGHPVLGSAFILGGPLQLGVINLETGAGTIPIELEREGPQIVFGWMRLPTPRATPFDRADELLAAVGVEEVQLPVELYDLGIRHVLIGLETPDAVAALSPDMTRVAALQGPTGTVCFAGAGRSWKARMFMPADGIPEDPATGSAAGPVAVHLARHGRIAWGDEIVISQGSEVGRPSSLFARAFGSGDEIERVDVGGSAVVVARGEFRL